MPTRNRANFIGEALESIISQANDTIEIVIIDGASTDNTKEVVQKYQKKFKNIIYHYKEKNGGVDRDMGEAIELANGDYCWLLSDDDALRPGAIKRMLKEIEYGYEIYLCNVTVCSFHMQQIRDRFWLSRKIQDRVFNLHEKDEMIEYCNSANSIGALFSFWSSTILSRKEWSIEGFNYEFYGTAYALASSLISFTKKRCRTKYIRDSLVLWRNDNESFQNKGGLVKRFILDFDGYWKIADRYLSNDQKVKNAFLKVMTREHPWYTIINAASHIDNFEMWKQFMLKMLKFGYRPIMVTICYAIGRFKKLVSWGVKIKRKILKSQRLQNILHGYN